MESLEDRMVPTVTVEMIADAAEPTTAGTFRFTRTGSTAAGLTVGYGVSGTATPGTDYTSIGSSVNFPIGESTVDVTVTAIDDEIYDPDETVFLTVYGDDSVIAGSPGTATVTIVDNDPPPVSVEKLSDAVEGGSDGVFRFTRLGGTGSAMVVNVSASGTATAGGTDYTAPTTVTIPSGYSTVDYMLTPTDDVTSEFTETVVFTITSGTGYTVGSPASAAVDILDDDDQYVSVEALNDAVEGGTFGVFRFTRIGDLSSSLGANYSLGGTATSTDDEDYVETLGTVTFSANSATEDLSIEAIHDGIEDDDETVSVTVTSGTGYTVGSPSSDSLTIIDTDFPPVAFDGLFTTSVNDPLDVTVLDLATDLNGDVLTVLSVTQGSDGAVTVNYDGSVTYTPDTDFTGDDSFTYTVEDLFGNEATGAISVTVTAPLAPPTSLWTDEDAPVTIDVTELAFDPDGDTLTAIAVTQGSDGSVVINIDGTVTYTPDTSFAGDDSFTYTVEDPDGNEATNTITVTVGEIDPVALDDSVTTETNTDVEVAVDDLSFQPAGGSITVTGVTQGSHGTVVNNNDGTVTYTPDTDYTGTDTFTYTVEDGNSNTAVGTITVTVGPEAETPAEEIVETLGEIEAAVSGYMPGDEDTISAAVTALLVDIGDYLVNAATFIATNNPLATLPSMPLRLFLWFGDQGAKLWYHEYLQLKSQEAALWSLMLANKALMDALAAQVGSEMASATPNPLVLAALRSAYQKLLTTQTVLRTTWTATAKLAGAAYPDALALSKAIQKTFPNWQIIPPSAPPPRSILDILPNPLP